jgi:YbgC/YbaW family acyl-CoA thioester hydrolase
MFETRIQTYWSDADAAGIVYYAHFFRFVESAEEDLFRRSGQQRQAMLESCSVWLPRVESFARYLKPIRVGDAIAVQLSTEFKGEKTVRIGFAILNADDRTRLAEGHVTVVCVDRDTFKARTFPDLVRAAFAGAAPG